MLFLLSIIIAIILIFLTSIFVWKNSWKRILIYALILISSSLLCSTSIYFISKSCMTSYKEVWNYKILEVRYYESWDERVSCRHPIYQTDSKGNSHLVGYEHSYDVDWNNEYWVAIDEYGDQHSITSKEYIIWGSIWKNKKFVDMHRYYHSKDGDMYKYEWDNNFFSIFPYSHITTYENRVRVNSSAFSFQDVSKEIAEKYPRPVDIGDMLPIVSYGPNFTADEQHLLAITNAFLGRQYEIHNIILLFDGSKYGQSEMQNVINTWKGPNKNELVTCIGLDDKRKIIWCDLMSWMDDTTIHSMIRQDIFEIKEFNAAKISEILKKRIPQYWKRKHFSDFEYITIEMPFASILINIILIVVISVIGLLIVGNLELEDKFDFSDILENPIIAEIVNVSQKIRRNR